MRKKIWISFIFILVLVFLAGLIDWPKGPDLNLKVIKIPYERELKVHLGLDLQGGTHLVYEADLSKIEPENYDESMAGVRDVIERRINALGVSEPQIQTNKTDSHWRVVVELPGVTDINEAIKVIGETPVLDFRELPEDAGLKEGAGELPQGVRVEGEGEEAKLVDEEGKPVDMEALSSELEEKEAFQFKMTPLSGQHLVKAQLQFDQQTNEPQVGLEFNQEGKKLFAEITERNVGKPLAIFLDGEIISAPRVNEPIREGKAVITGKFTIDEAKILARRLNAGALPVPIHLVSQMNVGATLGQISVEKSFLAGVLGCIFVAIFMIVYYRLPGLLAVFALTSYTLIVFALFKLIPVTLTLSGVAGFIISIGMAVDANVLIFERIKEELLEGKTVFSAMESGFRHAWSSIRDSNLSTLITCFILAWFGTSIIKGFAITLGIGILVSMFSAISISRTFLRLVCTSKVSRIIWLFGINKSLQPKDQK